MLPVSHKMNKKNTYKIEFAGLKIGTHDYEFEVENNFFDSQDYNDFNSISAQLNIELVKKATILELTFKLNGSANVNCDVTNEAFDLSLNATSNLVVKFGEVFNNEDYEILVLPHGEHKIDLDQYIFELIVLSLPAKRVHPGVEDGSLKSEILDILDDLKPKESNSFIDPRWNKLKKLKN